MQSLYPCDRLTSQGSWTLARASANLRRAISQTCLESFELTLATSTDLTFCYSFLQHRYLLSSHGVTPSSFPLLRCDLSISCTAPARVHRWSFTISYPATPAFRSAFLLLPGSTVLHILPQGVPFLPRSSAFSTLFSPAFHHSAPILQPHSSSGFLLVSGSHLRIQQLPATLSVRFRLHRMLQWSVLRDFYVRMKLSLPFQQPGGHLGTPRWLLNPYFASESSKNNVLKETFFLHAPPKTLLAPLPTPFLHDYSLPLSLTTLPPSFSFPLFTTTYAAPCLFSPAPMAAVPPQARPVVIHCSPIEEIDDAAAPRHAGWRQPPRAHEIDRFSQVVHDRRRRQGIPHYTDCVLTYAREHFGFTGCPLDMLRPEELDVVCLIQCERQVLPPPPDHPDADHIGTAFTLVELRARPRIAGFPAGTRFYVPGTMDIYLQTSPRSLVPVYTVLPTQTVDQIQGGHDLLARSYSPALLQGPMPIIRHHVDPAASLVIQPVAQAAAAVDPLDLTPLRTALLPLATIIVGDYLGEYTSESLIGMLRGAGVGHDALPLGPVRQTSTQEGAPQWEFHVGDLRHHSQVLYTLQDIVVYVTPASRPPGSTGSPAYEGSMTFLLSSDFVDGFPSAALAADAVRAALMARPEYPWVRVYVPAHTTDVTRVGIRYVCRLYLPGPVSFQQLHRDWAPAGFPLTATTTSGVVLRDFLRITPPLGAWITYGPGQLVFPPTDSDRLARLDDPPAHIISAISFFYREHDIPATERFTRERVTFDHDEQGNVRFTATMDLCPAALVMMRDFRIYPEGFARQESSFTTTPVLSIILNEQRQSASDGFVQVRPRPSAPRARLVELFPAVQIVFDRLLARERARAAATRRGAVPFIVELADAGENFVSPLAVARCPYNLQHSYLTLSRSLLITPSFSTAYYWCRPAFPPPPILSLHFKAALSHNFHPFLQTAPLVRPDLTSRWPRSRAPVLACSYTALQQVSPFFTQTSIVPQHTFTSTSAAGSPIMLFFSLSKLVTDWLSLLYVHQSRIVIPLQLNPTILTPPTGVAVAPATRPSSSIQRLPPTSLLFVGCSARSQGALCTYLSRAYFISRDARPQISIASLFAFRCVTPATVRFSIVPLYITILFFSLLSLQHIWTGIALPAVMYQCRLSRGPASRSQYRRMSINLHRTRRHLRRTLYAVAFQVILFSTLSCSTQRLNMYPHSWLIITRPSIRSSRLSRHTRMSCKRFGWSASTRIHGLATFLNERGISTSLFTQPSNALSWPVLLFYPAQACLGTFTSSQLWVPLHASSSWLPSFSPFHVLCQATQLAALHLVLEITMLSLCPWPFAHPPRSPLTFKRVILFYFRNLSSGSGRIFNRTLHYFKVQAHTSLNTCLLLLIDALISMSLLLQCGDVHPNPGPPFPTHASSPLASSAGPPLDLPEVLRCDHLNVLNWNCRGIDSKLSALPSFLRQHDIHIAILTETRRTLGVNKTNPQLRSGGYTFFFASAVDASHTASYLPHRAREWGVCIAVRIGLPYQSTTADISIFNGRLQHGILKIPTPTGALLTIDLLGVYAPAQQSQKAAFWSHLSTYVQSLIPEDDALATRHLILGGDWNSYIDPENDIYRSEPLAAATESSDSHVSIPHPYLSDFLQDLRDSGLHLFDPLHHEKRSAMVDFTYISNNQKYRSIPDKIFTSFSTDHFEPTLIMNWSDTKTVGLSDHRPVLSRISLARLCEGWIEYPDSPIRRFYINIDPSQIQPAQTTAMHEAVAVWRQTLPTPIANVLLTDPPHQPAAVSAETLTETHDFLKTLFVAIPAKCYGTGLHDTGQRVYKTLQAGQTQHILCWLQHYRLMLADLSAAKLRGAFRLHKSPRRAARRTRSAFFAEPSLRDALPQIMAPFSTKISTWTLSTLNEHQKLVDELHWEWKRKFDQELQHAKKLRLQQQREAIEKNPINSTIRRKYQLGHKGCTSPLPSIMKHPDEPNTLLTGAAVNEAWGTSATATRPNTMPVIPTEPDMPPWLDPQLWTSIQDTIGPLQNDLMAPFTTQELKTFLTHTGQSAPGLDGIQYNVLRHMCLHESLADLQLLTILQRFLNTLLLQQQIPASMKTAMLTFIHKSGDPMQYGNYRGISLLSCLFKLVTGTLNGRLQRILHEHTGLDTNQGANRKGVHAAHKAAVVMNIIADARFHKRPLHIIYTDIKGAFPSVPYQAFKDALSILGLGNSFLALIIDTQTDFTCIAKGPTGYSSAQPKTNGVHEGDCLSPTLFCLVLNMYFHWLRSADLGYQMDSAPGASPSLSIKIPVNGYADDMALIGNSHEEVQTILCMLQRFLLYYGMALNPLKCAYQYRTENPLYRPPPAITCWGQLPTFHAHMSYKYLGYWINMRLDFKYQYDFMTRKLAEACTAFTVKSPISIQEAIMYVNSDLISKLRYRMYLVKFPIQYLRKFESSCVTAVKRLARLAKSTPTDLLFHQGLYHISNLQGAIRADFLQHCLQSIDAPCRLTSQISYTNLKYKLLKGESPFSFENVQSDSLDWSDHIVSPIFAGVRTHLQTLNMGLLILFDTRVDLHSLDISATLAPLGFQHLKEFASVNLPCLHLFRLLHNLRSAHITSLDDLSPLFEYRLDPTCPHPWHKFLNRAPRTVSDILTRYASTPILHPLLRIPNVSIKQRRLLRILLHLFLEKLIQQFSSTRCTDNTETDLYWGHYRKHTLAITVAYPDGSANKLETRAGFGVYFPESPQHNLISRIPGHQSIARAEAYGVLATLMTTRLDLDLTIHCDRQPLVNQINRYRNHPPLDYEIMHLTDRSLLLRILEIIRSRTGTTTILHVKAHERDSSSLFPQVPLAAPLTAAAQHQEHNKVADRLAKFSLNLPYQDSHVPLETRHLSPVNVLLPQPIVPQNPGLIFENKPLRLYQKLYSSDPSLHYRFRGTWHTHLFIPTIWLHPTLATLNSRVASPTKRFLIQILGRTLPTFHRLHQIRPSLYLDERCILCDHSVESIEHLLYDCPFFTEHRNNLLAELVLTSRTHRLLNVSNLELRTQLHNEFVSPPSILQRDFSAGQLSLSFYHWLTPRTATFATALCIGKALHSVIVRFHQLLWQTRCKVIKERHYLFRDRLLAFPTLKPLHDMTEDDFITFASKWRQLHTSPEISTTPQPTQRPVMPELTISALSPLLSSCPSDPLPVFHTADPLFSGRLRISSVVGDGSCLFRALLRAARRDDLTHIHLRQICVHAIVSDWNTHTHQLNAVHGEAPQFASSPAEPFPTSDRYSAYMSSTSAWGTEVEAFVCARLLRVPLLIWSTLTGATLHPLVNFLPSAPRGSQDIAHISFSGNHFDALLVAPAASSRLLSQQAIDSLSTSRSSFERAVTAHTQQSEMPASTSTLPDQSQPTRSFRRRSQSQLAFGTAAHQTKRRRTKHPSEI